MNKKELEQEAKKLEEQENQIKQQLKLMNAQLSIFEDIETIEKFISQDFITSDKVWVVEIIADKMGDVIFETKRNAL